MNAISRSEPVGCLVLAAGAARRMGRLKQLLTLDGVTLLDHAVEHAFGAGFSPVVLVVGAEADRVAASIHRGDIEIALNQNWEAGMGSSITLGIRELLRIQPQPAAVCVTLADQPLVKSVHLEGMMDKFIGSKADVVAAHYRGTLGAPALFSCSVLPSLLELSPGSGAKKLFYNAEWNIQPFDLPEAASDIDTPEDFAQLSSRAATEEAARSRK